MRATGWIASWKEGQAWMTNATRILQEGYDRHGDFAFQFRALRGWWVCLCDEAMIKEYMNLSDEYMSLNAYDELLFETRYTAPGFADSLHHIPVPVLSKALTWSRGRSSGKNNGYFQELVDELEVALASQIAFDASTSQNEQQEINCLHLGLGLMLRLICKVLVGEPLCRDPSAVDLFVRYGSAVPASGAQIARLPRFLKPLLGPYFPAARMQVQLGRLIVKQIQRKETDWMWRWVQQQAPGCYDEMHVAQLVVAAIFGSVHSAGMTMATCLYELSLRPEYIEHLQVEAERAIHEHGFMGKEAIESLTKLDSFIKECQRFRPLAPSALHRVATQDYTFQNGLTIPQGTVVLTPNTPILRDERFYAQPHEFDGFRFHRLGQTTGHPDTYKITGLSPKSRQFGDGRHTWLVILSISNSLGKSGKHTRTELMEFGMTAFSPGKQLAADMLRLILAQFVLKFDVQTSKAGEEYPAFDQQVIWVRKRRVGRSG
ncbi:Cytochrome P450 monooxygenase paxQ [Penicillium rolfsii]|nr:Cytochrome P450 monooxygenase paxQ [Penicillium rolfsii]